MINDFDLKEISEHNISLRKYDYESIREVCTELLRRRESDRWVPVSERLPEEDNSYLVIMADDNRPWSTCRIYNTSYKKWIGFYDTDISGDVTHWRPLPEPPEST